ncbi:MAG: alanine--tRNA ligase [Elusimicrobiales bacterium]
MNSREIRDRFLDFFKKKDHPIIPSSPLVPYGDPTLLFTSAGMVQFKPYYLGLKTDLKRAASCQKCFRTTDIDNVGRTIKHLTFFEMLGNFSFGDYFKEESLRWGYEFLTSEMGLEPERLYFSYYKGGIAPKDNETYDIWKRILSHHLHSHIFELGEDNFWSMGDTGPCGPCSEIYYDRGEVYHPNCPGPWCGCDRYIEIWNHVFTQFDKQVDGSFKLLPKKNIDTGMGLERLSFIVEKRFSPFETSLFFPIIERFILENNITDSNFKRFSQVIIENYTSPDLYKKLSSAAFDVFIPALRIISDHIKGAVFLISEGVIPSNEARGYLLRRLIRRALRYAMIIGVKEPCLFRLADTVKDIYSDVYPTIEQNISVIKEVIENEEKGFIEMLEKGERYINELLEKRQLSGSQAFWIYETYGFPYELIKEIAVKKGIVISDSEFEEAKKRAKDRSRKWRFIDSSLGIFDSINSKMPKTCFTGYDRLNESSQLCAVIDRDGNELMEAQGSEFFLVFDKTPFYAESGGQVADSGVIKKEGKIVGVVVDVQKPFGDVFYHKTVLKEKVKVGEIYELCVDVIKRKKISANHTATHLINASLKKVFGLGVVQAGSLVDDEKFRFDYTLSRQPTLEEIKKVEKVANEAIAEGFKVHTDIRPLDDAKRLDAVILPGERYSDPARFVLINRSGFSDVSSRFSLELCGGTHVKNLEEVFRIKIIKEGSLSRGIRRIEGVSGYSLLDYLESKEKRLIQISQILEVDEGDIEARILKMKNDIKSLSDKLRDLSLTNSISDEIFNVKNLKFVFVRLAQADIKTIRSAADKKKKEFSSAIIFIYAVNGSKVSFIITKTDDAGVSVKEIFTRLKDSYNIRGGGRDDFIQGGGIIEDINEFKKKICQTIN